MNHKTHHTHPKQIQAFINENKILKKQNKLFLERLDIIENKSDVDLIMIIYRAQEKVINLISELNETSIDEECYHNLRKVVDELFAIF